jgi:outer membrane protein assembly factor BamB
MRGVRPCVRVYVPLKAALIGILMVHLPLKAGTDWTGWRNNGTGVAELPLANANVGSMTNVEWKTSVTGLGYSSPIVFGDRLFATSAERADLQGLSWVTFFELIIGCVGAIYCFNEVRRKQSGWRINVLLLLLSICAFIFLDAIQRVPRFSNHLLAGSYQIRVWLVSGLVSATGIITAAFVIRRRTFLLGTVSVLFLAGVAWFALMVPDRDEISRLHYRWVYWLCVAGAPFFALSRLNFCLKWPITACVLFLVVSAVCVVHEVVRSGYVVAGVWLISGTGALVAVATLGRVWINRFRKRDSKEFAHSVYFTAGMAMLLVAASIGVFWKNNYGTRTSGWRLTLTCWNLKSQTRAWESSFTTTNLNTPHYGNSYASPTPVTDGARVYTYFGAAGVACFDFAGKSLWRNENMPMITPYGASSSPVLYEDTLIVACDNDEGSYIVGIDKASGIHRWKTQRTTSASFGSPLLFRSNDRDQMAVAGGGVLAIYEPSSGRELFSRDIPIREVIPSPVFGSGQLYVSGENRLFAFDLQCTPPQMRWQTYDDAPSTASPVFASDKLYVLSDDGVVTCRDGATGMVLRRLELANGTYHSSPIIVGNALLCCSKEGQLNFVKIPECELTAVVSARSDCFSSPAFCGRGFLIRTVNEIVLLQ